jgi:DNA-3-methyladenine glycosylase II
MHLMFQLRRPDVFAVDDLGVRRAMERAFAIPADSPKPIYAKRAQSWGPFRTAACRFLWDSLNNQPK